MEKEFVPYELALRMKALGFDEPCFGYYDEGGNLYTEMVEVLKAPLYQQAFRFFRKQYKLISFVFPQIEDGGCEYQIVHYNPHKIMYKVYSKGMTYEEAELACLRKLIEIVESKKE